MNFYLHLYSHMSWDSHPKQVEIANTNRRERVLDVMEQWILRDLAGLAYDYSLDITQEMPPRPGNIEYTWWPDCTCCGQSIPGVSAGFGFSANFYFDQEDCENCGSSGGEQEQDQDVRVYLCTDCLDKLRDLNEEYGGHTHPRKRTHSQFSNQ